MGVETATYWDRVAFAGIVVELVRVVAVGFGLNDVPASLGRLIMGIMSMFYARSIFGFFTSLLCICAVGGCESPKTATVTGTVKINGQAMPTHFNGKQVSSYRVVFAGQDNAFGWSPIGPDGTYTVTNAPVGNVRLTIEPYFEREDDSPPKTSAPMEVTASAKPKPKKPQPLQIVPARYRDRSKSGLSLVVELGSQTHDIALKAP